MGKLAPVYLTAVLEYVVAELVEQTGLLAKLLGSEQRISPKHIRLAVTNDEGINFRIVICLNFYVQNLLNFFRERFLLDLEEEKLVFNMLRLNFEEKLLKREERRKVH